ncbi:rod shape-determining protein MreD [Salinispira pacifica]
MALNVLVSSGILSLLVLLQTNILRVIAIGGAVPDVALIVLVFLANRNGSMPAQVSGFVAGIVQDLVSLAPLGFHAVVRTVTGYLFGLTRGNIFVDPILVPVLMVLAATVLKGLMTALIAAVFGLVSVFHGLFSTTFLIELLYNSVLAPFLFGILGLIKPLRLDTRGRAIE